eukprot:gnl/TRDRNA2_/TRDRNA2_153955_c1_seq1.p1 gnl/TRDRNA2_/TRDRNA2_153955_c1~~gnl/TRDRNA2_/TRDRNA2_153955_c1_seq1.p1  ORF type:complete len:762 (+),score=126.55 gnl/TRDRNA2_/TRDRNA2_153955_c1_seq1:93-2378(+)
MEKSGLGILLDEKRVNDLLKQRSGAWAVIRSSCNIVLFIVFVLLYTLLAIGEPLSVHHGYEAHLRKRFDHGSAFPMDKVESIHTFWEYVNRTLMPGIYGNDTRKYSYPGAVVAKLLPIDEGLPANTSRLFGVVRVRELRVMPGEDCKVGDTFAPYFSTCHGPYNPMVEDREEFGPLSMEGVKEFQYRSPAVQEMYQGKLAEYHEGGFMEALTANYTRAKSRLELMWHERWVDESTRVLFIEFTIYNFNMGLYAVCRIVFEVAPSGRWENTFNLDIIENRHMTALGLGTSRDWLMLIGEAVLCLFILRYMSEEFSELVHCEPPTEKKGRRCWVKSEYLTDGWNMVDWANLLLIGGVLAYRFIGFNSAKDLTVWIGEPALAGVDTYTNLHRTAGIVRTIRTLTAFNAVLTWLKVVKYIDIIPFVSIFMWTVSLENSWKSLFSFFTIFVTSLVGFVLAFSVAFGEQLGIFRSPWRALIFISRAFLGNADMSVLYDISPILGSALIMLFIIGMVFIIMNLFYAIMISALSDAKQKDDIEQIKRYQKLQDKLEVFFEAMYKMLDVENTYRTVFPGLYSRCLNRKKKQKDLEKMRDDQVALRERLKKPQSDTEVLGPASPSVGRRPQYRPASVEQDKDIEDDISEADLGPLRSQEQLDKISGRHVPDYALGGMAAGLGAGHGDNPQEVPLAGSDEDESNRIVVELVLQASQHVMNTLIDRTKGARNLVLTEMNQSRDVLAGIAGILEVLSGRAQDLDVQQNNLLSHF